MPSLAKYNACFIIVTNHSYIEYLIVEFLNVSFIKMGDLKL